MTGKTIDEIREIKKRSVVSIQTAKVAVALVVILQATIASVCFFETEEQMRSSGIPDEFEGVVVSKQVTGPVIAY
jgi:hypothetical protein